MTTTNILQSSTRSGIQWLKDTRVARETDFKRYLKRACFEDRSNGGSRVKNVYINTGCSSLFGEGWSGVGKALLFGAGQAACQKLFSAIGSYPAMGTGMCGSSIFNMAGLI